jgi:hypothetical protein
MYVLSTVYVPWLLFMCVMCPCCIYIMFWARICSISCFVKNIFFYDTNVPKLLASVRKNYAAGTQVFFRQLTDATPENCVVGL